MSVFGVVLVRISRIPTEYGKIRTRITSNADTFYVVEVIKILKHESLTFLLLSFFMNLTFFISSVSSKIRIAAQGNAVEFPVFYSGGT